ncbi:MAG: hypothetical protein KME26_24570 [Oscillatoria princeps RMCB-10]|jgi:hypothetical protein|nr:hypothetical protein [Oscillatoria princeps RMCB-10]
MIAHFQTAALTTDDRLSAKIQQNLELAPPAMQQACANPEVCQMVITEMRLGEVDIYHAIWRVLHRHAPESLAPSVWFG